MPPLADRQTIVTCCSHCGKEFRVNAVHVGKRPSVPSAAGIHRQPAARFLPRQRNALCSICQSPMAPGEATSACPGCGGQYHAECWTYNGGCGIRRLRGGRGDRAADGPGESSVLLGAPEEKPCPNCGQSIMAAAVPAAVTAGRPFPRPGTVNARLYHCQQKLRSKLHAGRTLAVWLLVFSLIPCWPRWRRRRPEYFWYLGNRGSDSLAAAAAARATSARSPWPWPGARASCWRRSASGRASLTEPFHEPPAAASSGRFCPHEGAVLAHPYTSAS